MSESKKSRMEVDRITSPASPAYPCPGSTRRVLVLYTTLIFNSSFIRPIHTYFVMFNAPRRPAGNHLSSSAFISPSSGSNYMDPLAQSTPNPSYGEVDPWSTVPSPAPSGTPRRESQEVVNTGSVLGGGREGLNAFFSASTRQERKGLGANDR